MVVQRVGVGLLRVRRSVATRMTLTCAAVVAEDLVEDVDCAICADIDLIHAANRAA